jgi:hypothetical protein
MHQGLGRPLPRVGLERLHADGDLNAPHEP